MPVTVSVVIAAYEAEAFVGDAVRSALRQTLRDIEVIVVDDGSRDGTARAVRAAAAGDPRVRLFVRPANAGVAAARNVALDRAQGRWIAVLDADDTFADERLERLVAAAEARGADLLADNIMLRTSDGSRTPAFAVPDAFARAPVDARRFIALDTPGLETLPVGFMKPLMRRDFLDRFGLRYPEGITSGEDFDVYVRCLLRGARFFVVPDAYYEALVRPNSLSRANPERNGESLMRSHERLIADARERCRGDVVRMLQRRAADQRAYGEYSRLSDHLHRGQVPAAARSFTRLARGSYVWRRFGLAARRRLLRSV